MPPNWMPGGMLLLSANGSTEGSGNPRGRRDRSTATRIRNAASRGSFWHWTPRTTRHCGTPERAIRCEIVSVGLRSSRRRRSEAAFCCDAMGMMNRRPMPGKRAGRFRRLDNVAVYGMIPAPPPPQQVVNQDRDDIAVVRATTGRSAHARYLVAPLEAGRRRLDPIAPTH